MVLAGASRSGWRRVLQLASAGAASAAARCQLVARMLVVVPGGTFARQLGQRALDLAPDAPDGDAEHALAALQQVDDLVWRAAFVDAGAVAHERDAGQVVSAALTQMVDGGSDLLQGDARVEQSLDHLEQQDVAEGVE